MALSKVDASYGTVVMGTSIVSVALHLDGRIRLSQVLFALAFGGWVALGMVVGYRLLRDRGALAADARRPAALTGVAATAVLASRAQLEGWSTVAVILLALAFAACGPLAIAVWRGLPTRTHGEHFMVTVAAEGLAAVAATVGAAHHLEWLVDVALALALAGMVTYPLVLARFDLRELSAGAGGHWVAGGCLALSALAFAQVSLAARGLALPHRAIRDAALILWAAAMLWLVVLALAEVRWPRMNYHPHRWGTVFPLGMYAASSFTLASAEGARWIGTFARGWVWVAVIGWAAATIGMLRSRRGSARHSGTSAE